MPPANHFALKHNNYSGKVKSINAKNKSVERPNRGNKTELTAKENYLASLNSMAAFGGGGSSLGPGSVQGAG